MAFGDKGQIFQRRNYCFKPNGLIETTEVRTLIECMTECMSSESICIAVAYDSINRLCVLYGNTGTDCSPDLPTYRGEILVGLVLYYKLLVTNC